MRCSHATHGLNSTSGGVSIGPIEMRFSPSDWWAAKMSGDETRRWNDVVVDEDDQLRVCGLDTAVAGRGRASVRLGEGDHRQRGGATVQVLVGAVGRTVGDHDRLEAVTGQLLVGETEQRPVQLVETVVRRHDHADGGDV